MNTSNVKKYAPKARKAFIEAMRKQAAKYGITKNKIESAEQKGDLVLIGDRPFPAAIIKPRERLVERVEQQGFDQVMEYIAYSWFNRLCAIRYMERKNFLDHGRRVLSAADGSAGVPQILEECLDVELPGLDQAKVRDLKLDGTKDEELYRELLLAQCHALHQAMPFLFEAVADESELLLSDNLTKTDSLIRDLVVSIPDEDWDHIEIIGWLYQFYISEKKDQVMGKVVKSEDIPAATQLFTPNWIVQYLVQNSVGRQWLQTYSDSPLKEKMPYYIEPAEQTPEVQAQIAEIAPAEITPESIKVLDPACGSGHILVEAYKVLKAIYEERGYRSRDIPQLILENNLFGLDIDDRAGQLAGFALMMLAREDDRRIFSREIRFNVLSLQESSGVNLPLLWRSLNLTGEWQSGISQGLFDEVQLDLSASDADNRYQLLKRILERFAQAKTFGSLIDVPHEDFEDLKALFNTLKELEKSGDSMQKAALVKLSPYVHQALLLAQRYDAVVANPPYMGRKGMPAMLKSFIAENYPDSIWDLYSAFIDASFKLSNMQGFVALITMHSWMFLASFATQRKRVLRDVYFPSFMHLGTRAFEEIGGEVVQTCAYVGKKNVQGAKLTRFIDTRHEKSSQGKKISFLNTPRIFEELTSDDFLRVPSSPICYWAEKPLLHSFEKNKLLGEYTINKSLNLTGNNDLYLRYFWEVELWNIGKGKKWLIYAKGGKYKKWYGNFDFTIQWDEKAIEHYRSDKTARIIAEELWWSEGITWTKVTTGDPSFRYLPADATYDVGGSSILFSDREVLLKVLGFLNSSPSIKLIRMLNTSVNIQVGDIESLPAIISNIDTKEVERAIDISKENWDLQEISFDFVGFDVAGHDKLSSLVEDRRLLVLSQSNELRRIEESINKSVVDAIGETECSTDVSLDELSLEYMEALKDSSMDQYMSIVTQEFASYVLGCIFGRYSHLSAGLVFPSKNQATWAETIKSGVYGKFLPDCDGIIPFTDQEWFTDDAINRFREFVSVVWGEVHLQENLNFVAESLCLRVIKPKKSESAMDAIRRYLSTQFYKDHLKTYKKRPIYWLFSSGKQKAFECLVYLHRYNEGTLARMRTEYVIPLTAKMAAYVQKLENDKEASGSAAEVKRLEKEITQLHKQQVELSEFDEKLRHYADQRIRLDLDDGVKVNYGKFGDLLAEVKAITGEAPEVLS